MQLCTGLKVGIEVTVHAMGGLYEERSGNGWGLLLGEAKNA